MCYYIKRIGHQESGSVIEGGTPNRGRYIYISKSPQALAFFPPLSEDIDNHASIVPVIPLNFQNPQRVYCSYVYNNSRHSRQQENGRDEYRLYLNHSLFFQEGDIVIFKMDRDNITAPHCNDNEDEVGNNPIHALFIYHCNDRGSALYNQCSQILNTNYLPWGQNRHAIFNDPLPEVEEHIQAITGNIAENYTPEVDDTVINTITGPNVTNIEALFTSQTMFRDFVLTGYNFECAITHNVIRYNNLYNLEAAHIMPRSHGGTFIPSNGIALSQDLHWAFDQGMFYIDDDYNVIVHPHMMDGYLRQFDHQQIFIPTNPFFRPAPESLSYHRENVFGLFEHSASLRNAPGYRGNR
ncbi:HNH endonuclease [Anaerovibrio sp.]|uniref:HNH endonuclease n=1 Tax=Anaerovibrio sp. TaxID=1872532 RepID=UPI00388E57A8